MNFNTGWNLVSIVMQELWKVYKIIAFDSLSYYLEFNQNIALIFLLGSFPTTCTIESKNGWWASSMQESMHVCMWLLNLHRALKLLTQTSVWVEKY